MLKHLCYSLILISILNISQGLMGFKDIEESDVYLMEKISSKIEMDICETSAKAVYWSSRNAEEEIERIGKRFKEEDCEAINIEDNFYHMHLKKDNTSMEIMGVNLEDKSQITVKINITENENNLMKIEKILHEYTEIKPGEAKYFKYLKGKLKHNNIDYYNEEIINILRSYGGSYISSINIQNGITGTADIGKGTSKKAVNLNYSICNYDTGSYLLIGTPILDEIY
ncbi:hypothetical protein [Clostridium polynesiense]|uniref:hypothetical protein n=1 Tax=Clostridium polynesiense TaxID=1325933 RepID=UPI00058BEDB2|nr:hypothetical protein [Clostridium polynesiense]